ncbi:MAG: Nodulation protein NolA [Nitrospira sp.]|nr:Nodulation protein NolA [Nitrospira sp.]
MATKGALRVGELAKRTGMTVRALHHYDAIGLLTPSLRTESGYRLYTDADVVRLQRIASLRQIGFSLDEVRGFLDQPESSLAEVIDLHIEMLHAQIEAQVGLSRRLEGIQRIIRSNGEVTVEQLLQLMETMKMVDKHYTPEQLDWLKQRREQVGEARIKEVEAEWPRLIAEVRVEMEKGTAPTDERVKDLAKRWHDLVEEFTGGNPEIAKSVRKMYEEEPSTYNLTPGFDREIMDYIGKALQSQS